MTEAVDNRKKKCEVELDLTEIPVIMQANHWFRGAQLMRQWLRHPANNDPKRGIHDSTTITMNWVLSHPRARRVYQQAVAEKAWVNPAAQHEIREMLIDKNLLRPWGANVFGEIPTSACVSPDYMAALDEDHIQYRPFNQDALNAIMDDLTAALANFNFRMLVKGHVEYQRKGRYRVTIKKVGIYVRDSYDFNDDSSRWYRPKTWMSQPLGYWNCQAGYAGKNLLRGQYVTNKDFREWRSRHYRGGDYLVFSDIQTLVTHDVFEIAS